MPYTTEPHDLDARIRLAAFQFLATQTQLHGDTLPRTLLEAGFDYDGRRVPLIGPQGIFKPAILESIPISITTVPVIEGQERPYDDEVGPDGSLRYKYRGTDPNHRDNAGLRLAMQRGTPLIYLHGVVPGKYFPVWPVFVTHDDPASLTFSIKVDAATISPLIEKPGQPDVDARRSYVTSLVRKRLHQSDFRYRVMAAYKTQCAVCRLRHEELLDAAHILPDSHPKGAPVVPNGLSLCKLHHAAFDQNIIGLRPNLKLEVREDVLKEVDGPMLLHGLQDFNDLPIWVPRKDTLRPNNDFVKERYELFREYKPCLP